MYAACAFDGIDLLEFIVRKSETKNTDRTLGIFMRIAFPCQVFNAKTPHCYFIRGSVK
jgi:hypothetical protein